MNIYEVKTFLATKKIIPNVEIEMMKLQNQIFKSFYAILNFCLRHRMLASVLISMPLTTEAKLNFVCNLL